MGTTPQSLQLYAFAPGVGPKSIDVQVAMPQGLDASHVEPRMPRWRRTFTLSKELDTSKVQAECRDGVLQARIPKAAHAQPRRIEVKVG